MQQMLDDGAWAVRPDDDWQIRAFLHQTGEDCLELEPVDLGPDFNVTAIAMGRAHACALSADARCKCWGAGGSGRLGSGSTATVGFGALEMGGALAAVDVGAGLLLQLGGSPQADQLAREAVDLGWRPGELRQGERGVVLHLVAG